jgi:hypothetical protein
MSPCVTVPPLHSTMAVVPDVSSVGVPDAG